MTKSEKQAILEEILYRAADETGDLTPVVMKRFYEGFPESRSLFEHHGGKNCRRMEADMVESALYSLMTWYESPAEIEIMFGHTIPHHELLNIPVDIFDGLLTITLAVIEESLDPTNRDHREVWRELEISLHGLVKSSSLSSLGISCS